MMNFCTLFDSYYIHKGIALYLSLERVTKDFHLYVMAFDRDCYSKLQSFGFKNMTVELSDDFETPELLSVKTERTKAEYCWTCGPSVIYYFLTKFDLPDITYLDSDLFFLSDPIIVRQEIGTASIALSEQGGENKNVARYGRYCVQYVFFRKDNDGINALTWWRDRCIEWCYSRYENGKYGDQKYLDQFEVLFDNVHIIKNRGLIGPWDTKFYRFNDNSLIYKGEEYPFVFYHMSGTKIEYDSGLLTLNVAESDVPQVLSRLFYQPYALLMRDIYVNFFSKEVSHVVVHGGNKFYLLFKRIRGLFRENKLAIFLYYKLLGKRYNGHGEKKIV